MQQKKYRKYALREHSSDAFRLHTGDISETYPGFSNRRRRTALARLLGAGGTHDTRNDPTAFPLRRSWHRFCFVLIVLTLIWLLGFFLP
ncbi:MAG: hypothetical protein IKW38_06170 [Kiritimatiellae bacterium]|jgi:hypothetical protein|nr:hypothetical protein [Kiritimatiellia bacterium]